jgi:hypothetical protein
MPVNIDNYVSTGLFSFFLFKYPSLFSNFASFPHTCHISTYIKTVSSMANTTELQKEITAVIKPWANSEQRPPFSCEQLITMALVLQNKPMNFDDILSWLGTTFDRLAYEITLVNPEDLGRQATFEDDMLRALHNLELPAANVNPFESVGIAIWQVFLLDVRAFL